MQREYGGKGISGIYKNALHHDIKLCVRDGWGDRKIIKRSTAGMRLDGVIGGKMFAMDGCRLPSNISKASGKRHCWGRRGSGQEENPVAGDTG